MRFASASEFLRLNLIAGSESEMRLIAPRPARRGLTLNDRACAWSLTAPCPTGGVPATLRSVSGWDPEADGMPARVVRRSRPAPDQYKGHMKGRPLRRRGGGFHAAGAWSVAFGGIVMRRGVRAR